MYFQLEVQSWFSVITPLLIVVLSIVIDYYIENVSANHMQPSSLALYSTAAMFCSALLLSYTWNHPYMARVSTLHKLPDVITEDHALSGGVLFSVLAFMLGKFYCGIENQMMFSRAPKSVLIINLKQSTFL